jgi:hypothetical protein
MIHAVPEGISRAARQMVMRHPNTMQCVVYRKKVLRESDSEVGGLPTLGGIGVLDSEDETAYEFEELGEGRIIFSGVYGAASGNMNDSGDGVTYAEGAMECRVEPVVEGAFEAKKHDQIQVLPGNGFVIPYEVVGITSPTSIPPYVRKLIVESRQDEQVGI